MRPLSSLNRVMVSATQASYTERNSHHPEELGLRYMARHSPFTHYFAVAARRGLEQGSATDIHIGASVDVGENHKASLQPADNLSDGETLTFVAVAASWHIRRPSSLWQISMTPYSDSFR